MKSSYPSLRQGHGIFVINHGEVLPTPIHLLRMYTRWKARSALLADDAHTLRELVDLANCNEGGGDKTECQKASSMKNDRFYPRRYLF